MNERSSEMRAMIIVAVLLSGIPSAASAAGGGDITFSPPKADPVVFSHDHHLKVRGLKCAACHFSKFSRGAGYEMQKETINKRDFCAHCHNGMKAFDLDAANNCVRCHKKRPS
jgi:c(7)-type cytochrome triheme protein